MNEIDVSMKTLTVSLYRNSVSMKAITVSLHRNNGFRREIDGRPVRMKAFQAVR
jgi:hypothetical protein